MKQRLFVFIFSFYVYLAFFFSYIDDDKYNFIIYNYIYNMDYENNVYISLHEESDDDGVVNDSIDNYPEYREPHIEEPHIEEPVVEPPIVEPIVEEPPVVESSIVEPVVESHIVETVVEPVVEESPVVVEPIVEPVVESPIVEPIVEEPPIVESPVVEPVVESPVVEPPVVEPPVVEPPVVEPQVVLEPVVEEKPVVVEEPPKVDIKTQIPKIVFIVPYRDREEQYKFFVKHMKYILEDYKPNECKIFFIHQNDKRGFNRGAIKNIGFLFVKKTYPNDYQNMTLVFNDIDIMPLNKNFIQYETKEGTIKHFYGFKYALGGIFSINAKDFEKINGFPNFWGWGYEDNLIQMRSIKANITIDRTQFYDILDKNFIFIHDKNFRDVNKTDFIRYTKLTPEGINSIYNVQERYEEETGFVHIDNFQTEYEEVKETKFIHDLRKGATPFKDLIPKRRFSSRMPMFF